MTSSPPIPTVRARIKYAIENDLFPESVAESAVQILQRLEQPLRIVLLGLPQSGKSMVLNLLLGRALITEGQELPSIQVKGGTNQKIICVLSDGTQKVISGTDLASLDDLKPVFVTLVADLPALSQISLLEIVADDVEGDQRKAIAWGCKRADIAIWCSTKFDADEQELWSGVPDHLKDHGFLILTKSDLSRASAKPGTRLEMISKAWGDEFRNILSVSAKQALDAHTPNGELDRALFKTSGASGLIAAIKRQVENGRRAAMDHGEQVLAKHCAEIDFAALVPKAEPELDEAEKPGISDPLEELAPAKEPKAASSPKAPVPKKEKVEKPALALSEADRKALDDSIVLLADRARNLADMFDGPDKVSVDAVVLHSDETVAELSDALGKVANPELKRMSDLVFEIQDIIMLMKLERGEARADDAITMLLQVRRELEDIAVK